MFLVVVTCFQVFVVFSLFVIFTVWFHLLLFYEKKGDRHAEWHSNLKKKNQMYEMLKS